MILCAPAWAGVHPDRLSLINAQMDQIERSGAVSYAAPGPAAPVVRRGAYSFDDDFDPTARQKLDPRRVHSVELGAEQYYSRYTESGVKISGPMSGPYINYAFRPPDSNFLNNAIVNVYMIQARYAEGSLRYKGSGEIKDQHTTNTEIRALVGKDMLYKDDVVFTPYVGFAYRHLFHMAGGHLSSTGQFGYDRHSTYYYLPVGVQGNIPYKRWSVAPSAEFDFFLAGKQVSDLSDGNDFFPLGWEDVKNHQKTGYGVRGGVKVLYSSTWVDFYMEPFVRIWRIDDSDTSVTSVPGLGVSFEVYEPRNHTMEIGSRFGLLF